MRAHGRCKLTQHLLVRAARDKLRWRDGDLISDFDSYKWDYYGVRSYLENVPEYRVNRAAPIVGVYNIEAAFLPVALWGCGARVCDWKVISQDLGDESFLRNVAWGGTLLHEGGV